MSVEPLLRGIRSAVQFVLVPGIGGSDAEHWQSRWQDALGPRALRIRPASWDEPDAEDWVAAIDAAVTETSVLVAHSLGCLAVAAWSARLNGRARPLGAFLVAAPDPGAPSFPARAHGFDAPSAPLDLPGLLISSSDDPYCQPERSRQLGTAWRTPVLDVGAHGHLNGASNLGDWCEGQRLLVAFLAGMPGDRTPVGSRR